MSISDLRQSYDDAPRFDVADLADDPVAQFHAWFADARDADIKEPNAMTLATVDHAGRPDARIVLLKDADARGFTFYTNYDSAKARQMASRADVSLVFYWDVLFRQVRIRGTVSKVGRDESLAYWATRPRGSRLGAIASQQSSALADRAALETAYADTAERYAGTDDIPLPDGWGGYRVAHDSIEFWQGQPSRLHDRLVYAKRDDGGWTIKRLAP
ncbi:MAG: pyridoxamine 5'-phosphate oxidase [Phycisphaerales bacterium JB063]